MRAFVKQNVKLDKDIKSDDMIRFKFDYYNSELITPLEDNSLGYLPSPPVRKYEDYSDVVRKKEDLLKFHNMLIKGKFNSLSRIDKTPIIIVDLDQPDRNDKINEILK